jgi:predicted DNA-binding protein (MmcQ/YjbR family)
MMGEYEGRGSLSFKSDKETQQLLIQQGTYTKTPYIGQHGWVSIAFGDEIDWDELGPLLEEAYLRAAPKRLAQRVMADRDAPE